ncbi:MAG: hypothetical protein AB7K37_10070 [Cyclobacteriaceae bacterium]
MNIDVIIIGLISLLIGLVTYVIDKPRTAKEKRYVPLGLAESQFKASKWALLIGGTFMTLYGLFNQS